uniref:Uncharacterized protein n=1 Tax=Oryza glaberrima TaxID=4538 RepID=I1QFZ6_ORYGL
MAERRLGRGRKAARRRWWWEDGRMSAATARRTWSPPSTAAMRTSEFAIADLLASSRSPPHAAATEGRDGDAAPRCSAHRKEPGCVVGEHAHSLLLLRAPRPPPPRDDDTTAAVAWGSATRKADGRRPPTFGWRVGGGGERAPAPDESLTRRQTEGDAGVGVVDLAIGPSAAWRGGASVAARPNLASPPRREFIGGKRVHHSKPKQVVSSSSSVWLPLWALGRGPHALFTLQRASRSIEDTRLPQRRRIMRASSPLILQSKDLVRSLTICLQMIIHY